MGGHPESTCCQVLVSGRADHSRKWTSRLSNGEGLVSCLSHVLPSTFANALHAVFPAESLATTAYRSQARRFNNTSEGISTILDIRCHYSAAYEHDPNLDIVLEWKITEGLPNCVKARLGYLSTWPASPWEVEVLNWGALQDDMKAIKGRISFFAAMKTVWRVLRRQLDQNRVLPTPRLRSATAQVWKRKGHSVRSVGYLCIFDPRRHPDS